MIAEADRLLDESSRWPRAATPTSPPTASTAATLVAETADGAVGLADPAQFAGLPRRRRRAPDAVLLRRNGLHVELTIDPEHRVGRQHHAGVADVVLESAVTTIVDLEDSVATVDGAGQGGWPTAPGSA